MTPGPVPKGEGSYEFFLSYNRADREEVASIHSEMLASDVVAFRDEIALQPGAPFMPELAKAIKQSRAVAVFIAGNGVGKYQEREIDLAIDHQIKQRKLGNEVPVFAVLLPGAEEQMVPDFLILNTLLDLRKVNDTKHRVERLLEVSRGSPPSLAPPKKSRGRMTVALWACAAVVLAAGFAWLISSQFPPHNSLLALQGTTALDWKNVNLWEGARWSTTDPQTLTVMGSAPGFLRLGSGMTLGDFKVILNVAIQANQSPVSWLVRSEDGAKQLVFRYAPPSNGAPGVFTAGQGKDDRPCHLELYTEAFGPPHALYIVATYRGESANIQFNLTCPNSDPRCDGKHDVLENRTQTVPCALPPRFPRARRFGLASVESGSFVLQEFELTGLGDGKP